MKQEANSFKEEEVGGGCLSRKWNPSKLRWQGMWFACWYKPPSLPTSQ